MIKSLDDVYRVGTFTQIHEMQDLGDKLRMVVMGHRRIVINGVYNEGGELIRDKLSEEKISALKNGLRRRSKRATVEKEKESPLAEQSTKETQEEASGTATAPEPQKPAQILMVDTSNLNNYEYENNQEVKALTNEVIKTIRDIIALNPLYRFFCLRIFIGFLIFWYF